NRHRDLLVIEDEHTSQIAGQLSYWKTPLSYMTEQIDQPADRPRPSTQSFRGVAVPVSFDGETQRKLIAVGLAESATPVMVVHSGLAVLLERLSGA
ncbi:hypothetical protein, partial [Nocardia farcinica]|uniref:hypothetical protein n=1 Tax=Nocardia farcinica TaxID=37329 RepID=UPI00189606C1